jgi:nitrogen fixation NifU-like protein
MSDMRDLYQELIIDHGRNPRNFGDIPTANRCNEGFNPLCGDKIKIYILEKDNKIEDIKFKGEGCAISVASASLMTQALKGKSIKEAENLFHDFHEVVTGKATGEENLGKLSALSGVAEYPVRVKCATLCWHTLLAALHNKHEIVSTEE